MILLLQANATVSRQSVILQPFWEWRFQVAHGSGVTVRLVNGVAERSGTELALNKSYTFRGTKGSIFTPKGCILDFEGECQHEYVAEKIPDENNSMVSYQNLHFLLQGLRSEAGPGKKYSTGPRIMIVGPNSVGKTTLARTLTAYAVKNGSQPLVVNTDPREGMLSLPGTLTAAVFATTMDIEGEGTNGWGGTPTSGPSAVPVKLPIVYYYGHPQATDDDRLYKEVVSSLASAVTSRMSASAPIKTSGLIIDTPAVHGTGQLAEQELDGLEHIVDEFSVNLILALGSAEIGGMMEKRFHGKKTSLGDAINVCALDKSDGVVQSDEAWLLECQHAAIKNYFYGDAKGSLSSPKQTVDFDTVTIYRLPHCELPLPRLPLANE